jgi:chitinase
MMLWEISGDDATGSLLAALDTGNPGSPVAVESIGPGPAIAITQPADCAISLQGFNQVINANAGGTAVQVEYFANGPLSLGFDNRAPWSWAWFNLPAGEHKLTAAATDSFGWYQLSDPVRLTVYGEDSGVALWQTGVTYAAGDKVFYDGCIYAAKRLHVGSRVRLPTSDRYWSLDKCEDCGGGGGGGGGGGSGQPPTVTLTDPTNGASFIAPATIDLAADAGDSDGDFDRVEFYQSGTWLCTDSTDPYQCSWGNVAAGSYTLRAEAFDKQGNSAEDTASVTVVSSGGCSLQQWSSTTTYPQGALVQHKGIKWKAKRESTGVEPGTSPAKWTNLGTCTS